MTKPVIEIEWLDDTHDCETCGPSYATGAVVRLDGKVLFSMKPLAHCYDGTTYDSGDVYTAILERLGYRVVQ